MSEVIRFNYLYRDSGNYKKFGSKFFSNPDHLLLKEIELKIRQNLIGQEYFYPDRVKIERFKIHKYLHAYSWYEFKSVEGVEGILQQKKLKSINGFCSLLEK